MPKADDSDLQKLRPLSSNESALHERALLASKSFKISEAELMEALIAVDQERVYLALGYPSLFRYASEALQLSEAVAYSAVAVARKANEVPALREAVGAGELGLSKAKKVLSVLSANSPKEEQSAWITKAVTLSSRGLEKEVARVRPVEAIAERAVYRSEKRLELRLGVAEEILLDFRRAQDRLSSTRSESVSLEETLGEILRFYLHHKDPETRARRVIAKKGSSPEPKTEGASKSGPEQFTGTVPTGETITEAASHSESSERTRLQSQAKPQRKPLPAALLHQVRFRDQGRCQFLLPGGKPCASRRWIEIHHRTPLSQGGQDILMNLVSLCRAHHQAWHHRGQ